MGYYIHSDITAQSLDLAQEDSEVLYVLQVGDLIQAYDNLVDGADPDTIPHWEDLDPDTKTTYIESAINHLENWASASEWNEALTESIFNANQDLLPDGAPDDDDEEPE